MKVILAAVADGVNNTPENKLNLLGVFTAILSPSAPALHHNLFVAVTFQAGLGEKGTSWEAGLILRDPDNKAIAEFGPLPFDIPANPFVANPVAHAIFHIQGIILPVFGGYTFEIRLKDERMGEVELSLLPLIPAAG